MSFISTFANQSVYIDEILDAFQSLLEKALGWSSDRVIEYHHPNRPNVDPGRMIVWYGFVNRQFDTESGAGRYGTRSNVTMAVHLTTRLFTDSNMKDKRLIRKHLNAQLAIENAFYGQMLFPAYQDRRDNEPPAPVPPDISEQDIQDRLTGVDGAPISVLTVATMTAAELPAPERVRPEQGYFDASMGISVPCVLRITVGNDADAELDSN